MTTTTTEAGDYDDDNHVDNDHDDHHHDDHEGDSSPSCSLKQLGELAPEFNQEEHDDQDHHDAMPMIMITATTMERVWRKTTTSRRRRR